MKFLFATIATLIYTSLQIQAQDTLTIEKAIQIGLQNNFQVRISESELDIASNNNSWGNAGRYPTISFEFLSRNSSQDYNGEPVPGFDSTTLAQFSKRQDLFQTPSVKLNWVVFNGFRVNITKAQLDDLQGMSEGSGAIVIENTLQGVLLSYYGALLQKEALGVLNEVMSLSRDRYNYVRARKEFGNAVTFDVLQAENSYLSDSANVLRQQINYENSLRNLNLVLAEPIDKRYELTSEFDVRDEDFILGDLISKLESTNKTLQNQYLYQEVLKKNVKLSQTKLYPVISVNGGISKTWLGLYGDFETGVWNDGGYTYNLNLALNYTLSDGGNVRRAIRNTRIQQEIGELQLEEMRSALYNQLYNSLEQYNIKRRLKHVADVSVKSARLNLQIAEEKYKSGVINSFNYRDIQIIYLNAARDIIQANFNVIESYTELLRLTGGIVTEYQ